MPKIAILCFLIRPELTNLWIFKNPSNANNDNVYNDDGITFGIPTSHSEKVWGNHAFLAHLTVNIAVIGI